MYIISSTVATPLFKTNNYEFELSFYEPYQQNMLC